MTAIPVQESVILDALREGLVAGLTELSSDAGEAAARAFPRAVARILGHFGFGAISGAGTTTVLGSAAATIGVQLTKKAAAVLLDAAFRNVARTQGGARPDPYATAMRLAREVIRLARGGGKVPDGHLEAVAMELERVMEASSDSRRVEVLYLSGLCYGLMQDGGALARERLGQCSTMVRAAASRLSQDAAVREQQVGLLRQEADSIPAEPRRNRMVAMRGAISFGPGELRRHSLLYEARRTEADIEKIRVRACEYVAVADSIEAVAAAARR